MNPILRIGERLRPALFHILPTSLLRSVKARLLERAFRAMKMRAPYQRGAYPAGVNFIGYLRAQMGLGQGARLMAHAIEQSTTPLRLLNFEGGNPAAHGDSTYADRLHDAVEYDVNIIHINPEQLPLLASTFPADTWSRRYNIGIWLWELEEFPPQWHDCFAAVDEVWAPSSWGAEVLRAVSPVPVRTIPYGIEAPVNKNLTRADFHLPQGLCLFLCMYDVNSSMERKNPLGAIDAFKLAFPPTRRDVGLVVKINNPDPAQIALIRQRTKGYQNIFIIDKVLEKPAVGSLISCCDVFVSLHRSEGFGLVCAEAMLLGKPCVATNYSANTEFMDESCACPVDYTLTQITADHGVYRAGGVWAEPDIAHCARYLVRLADDKAYYKSIAAAGQERMEKDFSPKAAAAAISARLSEIQSAQH